MAEVDDKLEEFIAAVILPAVQTGRIADAINDACDRIVSRAGAAECAKRMAPQAARVREARANLQEYFAALERLENLLWAHSPAE